MSKALLIVGSPKQEKSSSHAFGKYLLDKLKAQGMEVDEVYTHRAVRSEEGMNEALTKMDQADLVILGFPLYVDSIPSRTIKFLEAANEHRKDWKGKQQRFVTLCHSGFPESYQNDTAIRICSVFAQESGFIWAGGLSIGQGGSADGMDLAQAGKMMRHFTTALDMTAAALAQGKDIPAEAEAEISKGVAPKWMFLFVVNRNWKKAAKANHIDRKARPYKGP
jgi:multimeric flavodoxin WrbA